MSKKVMRERGAQVAKAGSLLGEFLSGGTGALLARMREEEEAEEALTVEGHEVADDAPPPPRVHRKGPR
jgi:hypothetical protein